MSNSSCDSCSKIGSPSTKSSKRKALRELKARKQREVEDHRAVVWTARMIQEKNRKRNSVGHRDTLFGLQIMEVQQFKKAAFAKREVPVHRRAIVQIKNFERNPKLNDKKGIVKSFDKVDRRWRVELAGEGYTIA